MMLESLQPLLAKSSIRSWDGEMTDEVTVVLKENLTVGESEALESSIAIILSVTGAGGEDIEDWPQSGLDSGTSLKMKVPRVVDSVVVAKSLNDLLSLGKSCRQLPSEYLIWDGAPGKCCYWDGQEEPPELTRKYHQAVEFVQLLKDHADHKLTDRIFFFHSGKLEILLQFEESDLQWDIPVDRIREFLTAKVHRSLRLDILRNSLWERLRDCQSTDALGVLLAQADKFESSLRHGFTIALSELTYDKLLDTAKEKLEVQADSIRSIIASIETKSLAIPAALLLSAKEIDGGVGIWSLKNCVIILSCALFVAIMFFSYRSQKVVTDSIGSDLDDVEKELLRRTNVVALVGIKENFARLKKRLKHAVSANWIAFAGSFIPLMAASCLAFWGDQKRDESNGIGQQVGKTSRITEN